MAKKKHHKTSPKKADASNNKGTAQFQDNRPSTLQLKTFQEAISDSPQHRKAAQLQKGMQEGTAEKASPIQRKANKTGLPDQLKSGIENLGGFAMDDVKVHYNSSKPAQLQAHAYAQGTDIHLAPGQEKHLPHEAWHVVQQKQGRVKATRQLKSKVNINDDPDLEQEADTMGAKALQMKESHAGLSSDLSQGSQRHGQQVYQRVGENDEEEGMLAWIKGMGNEIIEKIATIFNMSKEWVKEKLSRKEIVILNENVTLYRPQAKTTQAAIYAHGRYTGDKIAAIDGIKLRYTGPHDSIANASLAVAGTDGHYDAVTDEPDTWHNYNLTKEEIVGAKGEEIHTRAQESKTAIAVVTGKTNTFDLSNILKKLGYTHILGIHCREVFGGANTNYDALTGEALVLTDEWPREQLNQFHYYTEDYEEVQVTADTEIKAGMHLVNKNNNNIFKVLAVNLEADEYTLQNLS